jgi:hypothetical protein
MNAGIKKVARHPSTYLQIGNIFFKFSARCVNIKLVFLLQANMSAVRGPGLYEFLIEAELQQYYAGIKNDLKVYMIMVLARAWPEKFTF